MCSADDFVKDFYGRLQEFRSSKSEAIPDKPSDKPENKPSPLSSVLDGRPFTKQCLDEKSFGDHDFLTRFDPEEVEWFINKPIENHGNTCVHEAVLSKCVDKLALILKHGGSPNVKGVGGKTPLHCACELAVSSTHRFSQEILKPLLDYGGDLCQKDNAGISPLKLLQIVNPTLHSTIVQEFCSTNIEDIKSVEKLHTIVQEKGCLEDFKQLYSELSNKSSNPRYTDLCHHTLLFRACKEGWMDGVKFILSEIKEILGNKVTNETPLHAACEGNHYEIVVELITKFPELLLVKDGLSHRRWHPIHTACVFGASDEILEALLVGISCLLTEGNERLTGKLANSKCFVDVMFHTPLYIATKCQNLSHIRTMMAPSLYDSLKQSAPTLYTVPSSGRRTPKPSAIHCAITYNNQELLLNVMENLQLNRVAYPSVFSMRYMLQRMHKDTNDKIIIYPLLETTICESSDGKLYLHDTNSTFKDYGGLSNLKLSPLAMSVAMGNVRFTEMFLNDGANDDKGLALRLALFLHYHDIAKLMLSYDHSNICLGRAKCLLTFELPSNILNSFTEIHLPENNLNSIPLIVFQVPKLTILNVSSNKLTELPVSDSLFQSGWLCTDIEIININNNELKLLPSVIWQMPKLKQLLASHNSITKIETTKHLCEKVAKFDVSHNQLTSSNIPQNVFAAEDVDVSYNKLEYLPDYVWKSKKLINLNAANNKIKDIVIPHDYEESACQSEFTQSQSDDEPYMYSVYASALSKLNLSFNDLTSFPKHLACFVYCLQNLDISNNQIPILHICLIPPYIKYLCVSECRLEDIKISCDQHSLCGHKKHTNLKNLSFLNLKGNNLCQFTLRNDKDSAKGSLIYPELEWLNLSNNQLCDVDANIGEQKHLATLNLSNNHNIKSLPLELSNLINTLSLLEIKSLPNLTDLHLKKYQTTRQMLSYMKSKMKSVERYRALNLMIVGVNNSGKTSLMKRLNHVSSRRSVPDDEINIDEWSFSASTHKIYFKTWDFPSQSAINYCFYCKQAIYLAVFKLTDGDNGIKGLEKYLRNIKIHAPGCPVMIIGTHNDAARVNENDISRKVHHMYSDSRSFPTIAGVCCVSNNQGKLTTLRSRIFSVAIHLHCNGNNQLTLANGTDSEMLNDPSALLQQYIPKSYLNLQNKIISKTLEMKRVKLAPLMNKEEFYGYFYKKLTLFEDEEELISAVQFLHCQSKLFHFEDQSLDNFYFLDLNWIFKTLMNVARTPNRDGILPNDELIGKSTLIINEHLQPGFLALLAKFDFGIAWTNNHTLIHTLLPEYLGYSVDTTDHEDIEATDQVPERMPEGCISTSEKLHENMKSKSEEFANLTIVKSQKFDSHDLPLPHQNDQMPSGNLFSMIKAKNSDSVLPHNLHRVWLASFIPDGFWPQFLTRIILDDSISSILSALLFIPLKLNVCSLNYASPDAPSLWKLYQKGFIIEYEQTKLLKLKEVSNEINDSTSTSNLSMEYANQIELTLYTQRIMKLYKEYQEKTSKQDVMRLITKLLVLIEQHILDIGEEWFPNTFNATCSKEVLSYVPCPLGLLQSDSACILHSNSSTDHEFLRIGGSDVYCFSLKDLLIAFTEQSRSINCPTHKELIVEHIAPDMCFRDLEKVVCSPEIPLIIDKEKELGSGGSALVLRGKMIRKLEQILVAVKMIHDGLQKTKNLDDFMKNYTTSVEGYRVIRKEVNFLSTLCHRNLTPLCGVRTNPFMLIIELAPLGSLSTILKQYQRANKVLTPAVLQASLNQVASAIDFLHQNHVVHLDLKSSNVLAWKFPSPGQQNIDQEVLLKIADYGLSRVFNVANQIRFGSITGTIEFIAPELYLRNQDLDANKIDVFAFGMFLYELITTLKPFELVTDTPQALLLKNHRPQIPANAKENFTPCLFQHIMRACWNHHPDDRPNMAQVLEWSQLPELQSLRTIHQLEHKRLLASCLCSGSVAQNHVHKCATDKPENQQHVIPNCDHFDPLFSSISTQTPLGERQENTATDHDYIQTWIAQVNAEIETKLTIVTFKSDHFGYHIHEESIGMKVIAMTNVGDYIWVCTNDYKHHTANTLRRHIVNDHKLYVVQTANLNTVACVILRNAMLQVVQLLHVPEWQMVLVLWELSEIWCLHDSIDASGVHQTGSLALDANNAISHLCKVTLENTTEIWGTREDKEIVIFVRSRSGLIESRNLVCSTAAIDCHLITCLHFTTGKKKHLTHVWVSFDRSSQLVCWDAQNKTQLHTISLHCEDQRSQCTSLLGHENHLYVGTSSGKVEVYDSESGHFLQRFSWHSNKVHALIELPSEIKQSICAESETCAKRMKHVTQHSIDSSHIQKRRLSEQPPFLSRKHESGVYYVSAKPLLQNSPLIISLGDGLAKCLNMDNQNSEQELELLTWTGYPTD